MNGNDPSFEVAIVGAGAAGLGMGVTLRHLGIEDFVILDRARIGASFLRWSEQTHFITPSFTGNQFGQLDLNAIAPNTSPAFSLGVEHPTGVEYAGYLHAVAAHFELPVETGTDVFSISMQARPRRFRLETSRGDIHARFVIWAGGEMQYPRTDGFQGAGLCLHYSRVASWSDLNGDERCIIGGAEGGIDAAVALAAAGRKARVFDREAPWEEEGSDPSRQISPFTRGRLKSAMDTGRVKLSGNSVVTGVLRNGDGYRISFEDGQVVDSAEKPVLANGFVGSAGVIRSMFDWRDDGFPLLTENDESTLAKGLFLVGPQVRHENLIFCFIYKFRQRFAVVANQIARRMRVSVEPLEWYRQQGMFLDDLSCCGDECAC